MSALKQLWLTADSATRIIVANVAVFILLNVPVSILHLMNAGGGYNWFGDWLYLNGSLRNLLFHPWTIFTHMFVHGGVMHLLFNMLSLFFIYQLFKRYFSDRQFVNVYFAGGLAGGLTFILSVNLFPLFGGMAAGHFALGASAAVMAVLVSVCTYRPSDHVFLFGVFRMQLRWIAIIFVLLDLINISGGNEGGHLAHLGGALFGFLWGINLGKGRDISAFFQPVQDFFKFEQKSKSRLKVAHKAPVSNENWNSSRKAKEEKVNEILDKISRSGYDSLSKSEKALLFELSKDKDT
ncbi:MAG: rhomboid family intramembrane serine protease [Bacteroidia bacterium]